VKIAILGCGLMGTSISQAASRNGDEVVAWDPDATVLKRSSERAGSTVAGSLGEAVSRAELVVVCSPIGSLAQVAADALAADPAFATNVERMKRRADTDGRVAAAFGAMDVQTLTGRLEAAEIALAAAERLDLTAVIADVLVTKGSALGFVGRTYEGLGALEAGRRLADARDYVNVSLRAQTNLGNILAYRDPAAGFATACAGYEVALRYGLRTQSMYLAGNASLAALRTGDWDWISDHMSDAALGEVEPFDRAMNLTYRSPVALFRGEPNDDIDEVTALVAKIPDPQAGADLDRTRAYAALAAGDGLRAFELGMASGEASTTNGPAPFALAARGALWAGDAEHARAAHDRFAGLGYHGPAIELEVRTMTAGIAALEGRRAEALALYREAWRGWREIGCDFDLALAELDAIQLLGVEEPDLRTAAEESRTILERLRARPLLERLAAAEGPATPASATRASAPRATAARAAEPDSLAPVDRATEPSRS